MAQKQVRICDRCGKERNYFDTTQWVVVKISLPIFEGKEQSKEYDLCDTCNSSINSFINNYSHPKPQETR